MARNDGSTRRVRRQEFDRTVNVAEVDQRGFDPQRAERELKRLLAEHDPARPSACRICGIACPAATEAGEESRGKARRGVAWRGKAGQDEERHGPGGSGAAGTWTAISGWKCCGHCVELLDGGLAAVLGDVVGEDLTEFEALGLVEKVPRLGNPSMWLRGWPTDLGAPERWSHVDPRAVAEARTSLVAMRDKRPKANTTTLGCMTCGVSRAVTWHTAPWRWGGGRGASGAVCGECLPWLQRSGAYSGWGDWRCHLLAAALGMSKAAWGFDLGIKPFHESDPADPTGTETPWAYLDPVMPRLRQRVLREHARLLVPNERERRVMAIDAVLAEPPQPMRSSLADV